MPRENNAEIDRGRFPPSQYQVGSVPEDYGVNNPAGAVRSPEVIESAVCYFVLLRRYAKTKRKHTTSLM